jgi:DNA-binding transcriptional MerR regulator/methylmalonyl-CoA mutase cobalamin-binding subunit
MNGGSLHPIRAVAGRTGLSSHVIRAWEKRYGAIQPVRTSTNRRLYTERDIERLKLLKQAIQGGRGIGSVALLPDLELQRLVSADGSSPAAPPAVAAPAAEPSEHHVATCLEAVRRLDAAALEDRLLAASISMPTLRFLDEVVMPLMHRVGELWHQGEVRPAHEHMASAVVRSVLSNLITWRSPDPGSPEVVVVTPAGQWHELGALAAAAAAASAGWRVTYMGANLPAEDIAAAARARSARAVALSLVYPEDDLHLHSEIVRLRKLLPQGTALLAGGRAASSYARTLSQTGAIRVVTVTDLALELAAVLSRRRAGDDRTCPTHSA